MLEVFVGLLLGSLLGEYSSLFGKPIVVLIISSCIVVVFLAYVSLFSSLAKRSIFSLLLILSFAWGMLHNWRDHEEGGRIWQVLRSQSTQTPYSLVHSDRGLIYARGKARSGDLGRLTCQSASERFEFRATCRFQVSLAVHYKRSNIWIQLANFFEQSVREQISGFGQPYRGWNLAVLLGDWSDLNQEISGIFRNAGMIHLLVLSGFHFGLIFFISEIVLRTVLGSFYLGRMLPGSLWVYSPFISYFGTICLGLLFLLATGISQPALRAFLVYSCGQGLRIFWGGRQPVLWIIWAIILQLLLAPIGFWQRSNLFSWLAYLWLVLQTRSAAGSVAKPKSNMVSLKAMVKCQLGLAGLSLILIGQQPSLGLLANIVLAPIFSIIFILSWGWILFPNWSGLGWLAINGIEVFFQATGFLASYSQMLVLPEGFSHLLTLLLIVALVCYSCNWCLERRKDLER